jgi:hypothetical protein
MGTIFQNFCRRLGIEHRHTASYHPQCNGLSEINNYKLITILRTFTNEKDVNWDTYVQKSVMIINRNINKITKFSPFFLLNGYNPISPFERKLGYVHLKDYSSQTNIDITVIKARELARERILNAENKWVERQNHDLNQPPFKLYDLIWIIDKTLMLKTPKKLRAKYEGPK